MHTENAIWIDAPPERVFALAADVAQWPALLPHYRRVRLLEERPDERVVEMAARRGWFPVKWTSTQRLFPDAGCVTYHHVRGITAGMDVEWRLVPRDGGTQVTILHDLTSRSAVLRTRLAAWIVGELFVKVVAERTLRHIKRAAEEGTP
jgi:ribosome-associated toxin RatA of RatAB toxin-antitoxin module